MIWNPDTLRKRICIWRIDADGSDWDLKWFLKVHPHSSLKLSHSTANNPKLQRKSSHWLSIQNPGATLSENIHTIGWMPALHQPRNRCSKLAFANRQLISRTVTSGNLPGTPQVNHHSHWAKISRGSNSMKTIWSSFVTEWKWNINYRHGGCYKIPMIIETLDLTNFLDQTRWKRRPLSRWSWDGFTQNRAFPKWHAYIKFHCSVLI
jgi:hypothetical protein